MKKSAQRRHWLHRTLSFLALLGLLLAGLGGDFSLALAQEPAPTETPPQEIPTEVVSDIPSQEIPSEVVTDIPDVQPTVESISTQISSRPRVSLRAPQASRDVQALASMNLATVYDGNFTFVTIQGNNAFAGRILDGGGGNSLLVLDVSDPVNPTAAGESAPFTDTVEGMVIAEVGGYTYAFIANAVSGLRIIDVTIPSSMTAGTAYPTGGDAKGIALATFGDSLYAFIANGDNGLAVWDVTDPTTPASAGLVSLSGFAWGLAISGDYAFVAMGEALGGGSAGLRVVDISTPGTPSEVGAAYRSTTTDATSVAISGNYAYLTTYENGLRVIDISTPSSPVDGTPLVTIPDFAYNIVIDGNFAFISNGVDGVRLLSLASPGAPLESAYFNTTGTALSAAKVGNFLYVATYDAGINVLGLSVNVSGTITDGTSGTPLANVLVRASTGQTALTDASGSYTLANMALGSVTITPSLQFATFNPPSRALTLPPPTGDAGGNNFSARFAIQLLTPAFDARLSAKRATLTWTTVAGATRYTTYKAEYSTNGINFRVAYNSKKTRYTLVLKNYLTYYWRVTALNRGVVLGTSATWHFHSPYPPSTPKMIAPINKSAQTTTPTFAWAASTPGWTVAYYQLSIVGYGTLSIPAPQTSYTILVGNPLRPGGSYNWSLRACNDVNQCSKWSKKWTIYVYPGQPTLVSPADTFNGTAWKPSLQWLGDGNTRKFQLQYSTNPAFTGAVTLVISGTTTTLKTNLLPATQYYWRVYGIHAKQKRIIGVWSGTFTFRTQ